MQKSFKSDIKDMFNTGHMVNRIIIITVALSLLYFIINAIAKGLIYTLNLNDFLFLSSDLMVDLFHPWVFITHLFVSNSIYELIWLMVLYYWFGSVIGDLVGDDKILPLYLFSGLLGSVLFLLLSNLFNIDYFYISGVKSAVIGTMVSAAVLVPDYRFDLVLIGKIRIKYIVLAVIILDLLFLYSARKYEYLSIPGSILAGWYFILSLKAGKGVHVPINNLILKLRNSFKSFFAGKNRKLKIEHKMTGDNKSTGKDINSEELNRLLDKIKVSGYESLSEEEKQFLFRVSKIN